MNKQVLGIQILFNPLSFLKKEKKLEQNNGLTLMQIHREMNSHYLIFWTQPDLDPDDC